MKIVVIGGSGLIGKKLVNNLREQGHEVVAASPSSGANAVTGEGLAIALAGAQVVVDAANSPSFEERAVLEFFETSSRNLLAGGAVAGVGHHVAVSVVGADRIPDSGYMRAKVAQEKLIQGGQGPLHDRPRDAVLRVRGRHRPVGHRGANGPAATCPDATHRVGRRRRRSSRGRAGQAVERRDRPGGPRTDTHGRVRPAVPGRKSRRAEGDHRPRRTLLRRGGE